MQYLFNLVEVVRDVQQLRITQAEFARIWRKQTFPVGTLPLFGLIDDVTDLHVERPIL